MKSLIRLFILAGCIIIGLMAGGCMQQAAKMVPAPAAVRPTVTVYVSGQVERPGVYEAAKGSTLAEVISLAGGFTASADRAAVNQEETVHQTTQVYVPALGEAKPQSPTGSGVPAARERGESVPPREVKSPNVHRPSASPSELERRMLDLINRERTSRGLKALVLDADLTRSARLKSRDMVENNYFAHESPRYGTMSELFAREGITYHLAGENLAVAGTLEQAHRGLMNSPGHRMNILNPPYTRIGIGIVQDSGRGLVITQHFAG
ncbi:MAG: CAP domain-containing protein [Negativicutes bacterium]|nr:CAP domain-containing protein [Negativicutes bacterium]